MTADEQRAVEQAEVAATSQDLILGATLNDIVRVVAPTGTTSTPMYTTGTGNVVLRQVAHRAVAKIVVAAPSASNRFRVEVGSPAVWGWIPGPFLELHHAAVTDIPAARNPTARGDALVRARPAMGFSYWWGRARWPLNGPTVLPADNRGACTQTAAAGCGDFCTHAATGGGTEYGGDCSGFISTMWSFPDTDPTVHTRGDGFRSSSYCVDANDQGTPFQWTTVKGGNPATAANGFSNAYEGDAIVKNDLPGDGLDRSECDHIWMVGRRRPSGSNLFKTYECRSCLEGCMAFERTVANGNTTWHVIRKNGW